MFAALAMGIMFFRTFSRLLFFYPARIQQKILRLELLDELEETLPARYANKSQGQIFQILFDDINNLRAFIGFGLLQIGNLLIAAWVLIPKLNQADSYLWPAFIPLFFSVVLFSLMTFYNQKIFKKMLEKKGDVQQFIIESYEAKQTIKNFHREKKFIDKFKEISMEELQLFFKSSLAMAFISPYIKLGMGLSLIWAALLIKEQHGSASDLVFFAGFLYLFLEPVMFLSWVAVVISQGVAAWRRVKGLYDDLQTPSPVEKRENELKFQEKSDALELDLILWDQIQLHSFKKSKWSVVLGETGSGKSTLLKNLATRLKYHNKVISLVAQEPYLFNDTVKANLFLGKEPSSEDLDLAWDFLCMFQLDSLEDSKDKVFSLEVGENGKRLSGGQLKRLSLVRSLLSPAKILIWDDPFSSVDIILEKKIIQKIKNHSSSSDRTFILSTHRLTTARFCDEGSFIEKKMGLITHQEIPLLLKDEKIEAFFKEQMVEVSLA